MSELSSRKSTERGASLIAELDENSCSPASHEIGKAGVFSDAVSSKEEVADLKTSREGILLPALEAEKATENSDSNLRGISEVSSMVEVANAKLQKRRRIRSELESLLPPPVDVSKDLSRVRWSSRRTWELRSEAEEEEVMWRFMKVCFAVFFLSYF